MNKSVSATYVEEAMAKREALADDPHRPQYHFQAPSGWMNDPHGLIQWQGQYHLFYQHNPDAAYHDAICWGHAVSDDLVHWRDLPIALRPTLPGVDAEGCWSGCTVDDNGVPTIFYTGVYPQTVCVAKSQGDLLTWEKGDHPVIDGPPAEMRDMSGGHFRDPLVWRENGGWFLLMASKIEGVGGMVLLYRSHDLVEWEYLYPLMVGDIHKAEPFWTGSMWECPNLLDFGDRRALIVSTQATPSDHLTPIYFTGTFEDNHFIAGAPAVLAHGYYFYAPQVMRTDDGRHLMWGWIKEARSQRVSEWAGWSGLASLPLEVSLDDDDRLLVQPARELRSLRSSEWSFSEVLVDPDANTLLDDVQGDCIEIIAEFAPQSKGEYGLAVRCSPDGQEQTHIVYQPEAGRLIVERQDSSLSPEVERNTREATVDLAENEALKLHIYLDRSVIEIFVNDGRSYLVDRIYPLRPDSLGIGLLSRGAVARVTSLDVWALKSIW